MGFIGRVSRSPRPSGPTSRYIAVAMATLLNA